MQVYERLLAWRPLLHQRDSTTRKYQFVSLIVSAVFENHDTSVRSTPAVVTLEHRGFGSYRVAVEHGFGKLYLINFDYGDSRAEREFRYREAKQKPQREYSVHDARTVRALACEFLVEMHRLRIHGQRRKEDIVRFSDGARGGVGNDLVRAVFVEVATAHPVPLAKRRPAILNGHR